MPKTDKEGLEYIEQDGKRYYRDFLEIGMLKLIFLEMKK